MAFKSVDEYNKISIHSLRVEGDRFFVQALCNPAKISIHSLRVEGDVLDAYGKKVDKISIHSLRVEGDQVLLVIHAHNVISIHSLRVEGDSGKCYNRHRLVEFQSTPSVWRETNLSRFQSPAQSDFNPLPPCGGRPYITLSISGKPVDFNPLPPCGGRQQNCTAFRLKLSRANAILTKKNTDILLHVRKNTFFLIFSRKSRCESLLLFLCA